MGRSFAFFKGFLPSLMSGLTYSIVRGALPSDLAHMEEIISLMVGPCNLALLTFKSGNMWEPITADNGAATCRVI